MKLRFTVRAREDFREIASYIARESTSYVAGEQFTRKLQRKCQEIAALPLKIGTPCDVLQPGLRSYAFGNYCILFCYVDDAMEVIRIIESHRNIPGIFT